MGKRLKNYIEYLEKITAGPMTAEEREIQKKELLVQISFFQHERLIHLLVTALFALLTVLLFLAALAFGDARLLLLLLLFAVLLVPYIAHYYRLENGVQRLYEFYDRLR